MSSTLLSLRPARCLLDGFALDPHRGGIAFLIAATLAVGPMPISAQTATHPEATRSGISGEYRVFRGDGTPATLTDVIDAMGTHEVVFIGEEHNDPVGHELEQALFTGAFSRWGTGSEAARPVILSLEMFERDVQYILDEYLQGWITEDHFLRSSRPWEFYESDYRPLVEFAKRHEAPVIASNAPRRYANRVTREGAGSLSVLGADALMTLPPLPFPAPSAAYRAQWDEVMEEAASAPSPPTSDSASNPEEEATPGQEATESHPGMDAGFLERALFSQSLWDAGMAYSITEHLLESPDALVLHMVGSFHVARGTGTPEQLEYYLPGTRSMVVVMRAVEDIENFDPERDGENEEFVILTEESQTRSGSRPN